MEPNFSGLVIDPAKCSNLCLEEKRELVHEISKWANNAPEILKSWSRKELLELICAELGQERKYSGVVKSKMISKLLKIVSQKNGNNSDVQAVEKKRKKEHRLHCVTDTEVQVENVLCQNLACRASMRPGDKYCKRCSCCICYHFDDNKDPSLWLFCSSDPPYTGDSCGVSCHLACALKNAKTGILKNGSQLDGSLYCVCCGKVNCLIGSWRKQLVVARDARRVDVLYNRLILSHKILKGTEKYVELHSIVHEAVNKLKREVGPPDKVSTMMARSIVSRLSCGAQVQKLCASAVEKVDSLLSRAYKPVINDLNIPCTPCAQSFRIQFNEITSNSVIVSLQSQDVTIGDTIIGCSFWLRISDKPNYTSDPTFLILHPNKKIKVANLTPSTEYFFKASPFTTTANLATLESKCTTKNQETIKASPSTEKRESVDADSQRDSTKSSSAEKLLERQYDYCVKVIRRLECEGHIEKEFRVKFLTWFSLKATQKERRVVSAFIDVLVDDPESLVAQLMDAFMDEICNKEKKRKREFCSSSSNSKWNGIEK